MTEICKKPIDPTNFDIQSEDFPKGCEEKALLPQAPRLKTKDFYQPAWPFIIRESVSSTNIALPAATQTGLMAKLTEKPFLAVGTPVVPVPILNRPAYSRWISEMKPGQQQAMGYWNFAKGALNFGMHDIWLYNHTPPASKYSNHNFLDLTNPDRNESFGYRMSPGVFNLFTGELGDIFTPTNNVINLREMALTQGPLPKPVQIAQDTFIAGRSIVSMHHHSKSANAINPPRIAKDDFRVQMAKDNSELLRGMSDAQVATLLSDYQASGDFGTHQDIIWYFQNILDYDISNETDLAIILAIGAVANTSRISPDGGLLALLTTTKAQAARANARSAYEDTSFLQFQIANSDMSGEAKLATGLGTAAGLMGLQMAAGSLTDDGLNPLTAIDAASIAGMSFLLPKFSDGDLQYHFVIADAFAPTITSKYNGISMAALNYASNRNYTFSGEDVDGDGLWDVARYKQNPLMFKAKLGANTAIAAERLITGFQAGQYLYQGKTEAAWGHVASAGMGTLYNLYLSTKPSLFASYNRIYKDTLKENGIEDPFKGPVNGRQLGSLMIQSAVQASASGVGIWAGFKKEVKDEKKYQLELAATKTVRQLQLTDVIAKLKTAEEADKPALEQRAAELSLQIQAEVQSNEFKPYQDYINALHKYDEAMAHNNDSNPDNDKSDKQVQAYKETVYTTRRAYARWNVARKQDYYNSITEAGDAKDQAKIWLDEAVAFANKAYAFNRKWGADKEQRKIKLKHVSPGTSPDGTGIGFGATWTF